MEIIKKAVDHATVIEIHGQIDLSNCHLLHNEIGDEVRKGNYRLIVNLKRINYIDSSCLGVLLGGLELVGKHGGGLAIVGNPLVDRVLTLTGLTRIFPFHSSVQEAVAGLEQN